MMYEKTPVSGSLDFVSIQYLRAIAASMVVIYHLAPQLKRLGWPSDFGAWLSSGVDIFFVISGFIMWVATSGRRVTPISFYMKRVVRIVPLYYILTTFIVALMLVKPEVLQSSRFDIEHVLKSYLFFPSPHPVLGAYEPVLIPGWTLNYEMFFYLLFGAALLVNERFRFGLVLSMLLVLGLIGLVRGPEKSVFGFYTDSIIIEFGLGVIIGYFCVRRKIFLPAPVAIGLVLVGFCLIYMNGAYKESLPRLVIWGIPAALVVLGAVSLDLAGVTPKYQTFHLLGDASYSVYLFHGIVLSAVSQFWRRFMPSGDLSIYLFMFSAVVLALAGGLVVYWLVERPMLSMFSKRIARKPSVFAS